MLRLRRVVLFGLLLIGAGLSACLGQTAQVGGASPSGESGGVTDVVSNQPGPNGEMPSGTLAPGGQIEGDYTNLLIGSVNYECASPATGLVRVSVQGKFGRKYADGLKECEDCALSELRAVYEDQGVRRSRSISIGEHGAVAIDSWDVDWGTVRFFYFPRAKPAIIGELNECPNDSCVQNASLIVTELTPASAPEDLPECAAFTSHLAIRLPVETPVLTFFGTREDVCQASAENTKVRISGLMSWYKEIAKTGMNRCPDGMLDCPTNETIQANWRLRIAYRREGLTKFLDTEFKLKPWDPAQYLWADANVITSDPSEIRLFIYDTVEQRTLQSLPTQFHVQTPESLESCFKPKLVPLTK